MEYQVSARKYRPASFSSVVGQEALTTTLKNAVKSGKLAHAFLFCGPRGVGKTTCARIFAKTINCENPTAEGEACGECESCRSFQEQRSLNVFELDAASNNSVENIKQLMEQTRIPPQMGRYKVFIIDEVHMLSTQAFNAFLKTLEEPPSYVIFILATTEKNKLLPTILSRCQIYDFDRMTVPNTINHLKMVAEREGYTYEEEALEIIAEKADGGMRDALSIFDQAASFCQGNITVEKVTKDLNLLDTENYFSLVEYSLKNMAGEVMLLLNKMLANGMDGNTIVNGFATHIRNLMMARDSQTVELMEVSKRYHERYVEQAKQCTPVFLFKALQILNRCDLNYRQSSNKRLLVELTLIEVAQITQPADDVPAAPRRGRRLKFLFKNYIKVQPEKTVQQVTAAVAPSAPKQTENMADAPAGSNAPGVSAQPMASGNPAAHKTGRPKLKSIGGSFSSLLNEGKPQADVVIEAENKDENQTFDTEALRNAWLAMCNRMGPPFTGLASSMKLLDIHVLDLPNVEVVVTNSIILEQMQTIRKRLEVTLARDLHNGNIHLNLRLAEAGEIKKVLTKRELLDKMTKESSQLKSLIEKLHLELV